MRADRKKYFSLAAALNAFLFSIPALAVGEIDVPRVLETHGGPEVRLAAKWKPLVKGDSLPKGAEIRTPSDAWVFFAFDAALESVARLGPESKMGLRGDAGGPVFLEKGTLFLLREAHGKADMFLVATGDTRVYVESGGISAEVRSGGTVIKVFGDRVRVATGTKSALEDVAEGFECRVRGGVLDIRRMIYADYAEWLAWAKRGYQIKDDADADVLEKEYGL